jgi:hypothetical protein
LRSSFIGAPQCPSILHGSLKPLSQLTVHLDVKICISCCVIVGIMRCGCMADAVELEIRCFWLYNRLSLFSFRLLRPKSHIGINVVKTGQAQQPLISRATGRFQQADETALCLSREPVLLARIYQWQIQLTFCPKPLLLVSFRTPRAPASVPVSHPRPAIGSSYRD